MLYQIAIAMLLIISGCHSNPGSRSSSLKALIIDGSNNHYVWPKTTFMMKDYLEQTGLFEVSIYRMDSVWLGVKYKAERPKALHDFIREFPLDSTKYAISPKPMQTSNVELDFTKYDLIVSNLGSESPEWPKETKQSFENYMRDGGGLIVVHAANNAWGTWHEFNKMIGLGAWGDRDSTSGPFVYYDTNGKLKRDHSGKICGSHGPEHEYVVTSRAPEHPIMKGLPDKWLHATDELYDRMRGPFEHTTILATAYSDEKANAQSWGGGLPGTGQHVPTLMAIEYGKGRIFHSTFGHFDYSMECVGFITTFQRGAEWAATGSVTQEVPGDFPRLSKTRSRSWTKDKNNETNK